jgi:hypothetical protein
MIRREAAQAIRALDAELAKTGDLIKLARLRDAPDGKSEPFYCEKIPARVKLVQPQEIVLNLPDSVVIISPSRLAARQWPAPPRRDDRIWITTASGAELTGNVEAVVERRVQGTCVRYEMTVKS